jgi:uncharacterized protein YdeI (YjbR/CyaY-like superfamily)
MDRKRKGLTRSARGASERAKPKFFRSAAAFRSWLQDNGGTTTELLVGFYKKGSRKPSITWPESVDEALCFGWIDGVRRRVDEVSYSIRFTPRKQGSIWSSVNVRRARALVEQERMSEAGFAAFAARQENKSGVYSYEQRPPGLVDPYARMLAENPAASVFFDAQTPTYRRAATWWIISAKKEETRMQRARRLIELSREGELIPQFIRRSAAK